MNNLNLFLISKRTMNKNFNYKRFSFPDCFPNQMNKNNLINKSKINYSMVLGNYYEIYIGKDFRKRNKNVIIAYKNLYDISIKRKSLKKYSYSILRKNLLYMSSYCDDEY